MKKITTPLSDKLLKNLKTGDEVLLSGIIFTARDAAHKRLMHCIAKTDCAAPCDLSKFVSLLKGSVIYYTGPSPEKPGSVIGSCGPTSSYRMDSYLSVLLKYGVKATIGKGPRSEEAKNSMKKYRAVYFAATGGAGALLSKCVKKSEIIACKDLGCEAIRKLEVKDLPLIVINDIYGGDFYK
ncbi:MAG: Fumarate hydratase class I, anaerobic [Elusimicrobia bacterium ADurb.Bin231]|nr:MAG: Fumarate hydratase class I, anaerobic [Elusimicrobia bacterium ADurb.Bin231]